ncbi:ParA family protein [Polymorphospora sp. NPDC050346]|uniref:ParA family protein n=1 Tax=Polymorphospora sp. NPDC050346 TaxID=3155780 RepID=UPI0033FAF440
MPAVVITFSNCTGGSAKTSTAAAVSIEFAKTTGKRILVVDIDPQRDLSKYFGFDQPEALEGQSNVVDVIKGNAPAKAAIVKPVIDNEYRGVDLLLGADHEGAALEQWIASSSLPAMYMIKALRPIINDYDVILIDGPGSMGIVGQGAAMAATYVVAVAVPLMKEVRGVTELEKHLIRLNDDVRSEINLPPLEVDGIVFARSPVRVPRQSPNAVRTGGTHYHDIIEATTEAYPDKLLLPFIRTSITVPDAYSAEMPINVFEPDDKASQDYRDLAATMIERGFTAPKTRSLAA